MQRDEVIVQEDGSIVVISEPAEIEVVTVGEQGPSGSTNTHYEQAFTAQSTVTVLHGLGHRPAVTIVDSAGDEVEAEVVHNSNSQLTLLFSANFSGTVLCN